MTDGKLWLGSVLDKDGKRTDQKFEIGVDLLRRHGGIFGSTGSGKTVLSKVILEEAALQGIPILAFDPQGDIASTEGQAFMESLKQPTEPAEAKPEPTTSEQADIAFVSVDCGVTAVEEAEVARAADR